MKLEYLIKIGSSFYLTSTGLVGGTRYITDVNINELDYEFLKVQRRSFRQDLVNEMTETAQKSKTITINALGLTFAHYSDLRDIMRSFDNTGTAVRVIGTHPYDTDFSFDLDCSFVSITRKNHLTTTFRDVEIVFTSFYTHT